MFCGYRTETWLSPSSEKTYAFHSFGNVTYALRDALSSRRKTHANIEPSLDVVEGFMAYITTAETPHGLMLPSTGAHIFRADNLLLRTSLAPELLRGVVQTPSDNDPTAVSRIPTHFSLKLTMVPLADHRIARPARGVPLRDFALQSTP